MMAKSDQQTTSRGTQVFEFIVFEFCDVECEKHSIKQDWTNDLQVFRQCIRDQPWDWHHLNIMRDKHILLKKKRSYLKCVSLSKNIPPISLRLCCCYRTFTLTILLIHWQLVYMPTCVSGVRDAGVSLDLSGPKHPWSRQLGAAAHSVEIWLLDSGEETNWGRWVYWISFQSVK